MVTKQTALVLLLVLSGVVAPASASPEPSVQANGNETFESVKPQSGKRKIMLD